MTVTSYWAGRTLTADEEAHTRRTIALFERCGDTEAAANYARFLPENDADWTVDELERGAHAGPWLQFGAQTQP
jgi:hypothetical protein